MVQQIAHGGLLQIQNDIYLKALCFVLEETHPLPLPPPPHHAWLKEATWH